MSCIRQVYLFYFTFAREIFVLLPLPGNIGISFLSCFPITVGTVLCSLIQGGYVSDKTIAKRLLKLLASYCENGGLASSSFAAGRSGGTGGGTGDTKFSTNNNSSADLEGGEATVGAGAGAAGENGTKLTVMAPTSTVVSEQTATLMHLVHGAIFAQLSALIHSASASDKLKNTFVTAQVKAAIASTLLENVAALGPLWHGMVVDAARIIVAESTTVPATGAECTHEIAATDKTFGIFEGATSAVQFDTDGDAGVVLGAGSGADSEMEAMRRQATELNPLRGGLTYCAAVAHLNTTTTATALSPSSSSSTSSTSSCVQVSINRLVKHALSSSLPATLAAYAHRGSIAAASAIAAASSSGRGGGRGGSTKTPQAADAIAADVVVTGLILPLFAVAQATLRTCSAVQNSPSTPLTLGATPQLINQNNLELLLGVFVTLARSDAQGDGSNADGAAEGGHRLPAAAWLHVLRQVSEQALLLVGEPAAATAASRHISGSACSTVSLTLLVELLQEISVRRWSAGPQNTVTITTSTTSSTSSSDAEDETALWSTAWHILLSLVAKYDSRVFMSGVSNTKLFPALNTAAVFASLDEEQVYEKEGVVGASMAPQLPVACMLLLVPALAAMGASNASSASSAAVGPYVLHLLSLLQVRQTVRLARAVPATATLSPSSISAAAASTAVSYSRADEQAVLQALVAALGAPGPGAGTCTGDNRAVQGRLCLQLLQNVADFAAALYEPAAAPSKGTDQSGSFAAFGNEGFGSNSTTEQDNLLAAVLDTTLLAWRLVALGFQNNVSGFPYGYVCAFYLLFGHQFCFVSLLTFNVILTYYFVTKAHIPAPIPLVSLLLCPTLGPTPPAVVLQSCLKFFQSQSQDLGAWLAGALFPAVLTRLGYSGDGTPMRVLIIKAILVLFSMAKADQKSALVELFLTPMCASLMVHTSDDAEFVSVCGVGLTHLARLAPDVFRSQVPLLTEQHRGVLQQVMKQALQQQQQQQQQQQAAGTQQGSFNAAPSSTSSMQINMSKYKK
jgi:hypothetical protein